MKKYKQLTLELRYQIEGLRKAEYSKSEIARRINVHKSTISRELKRNSGPYVYDPKRANKKAHNRKKYARKAIKMTSDLLVFISDKIQEKWSPEQISGYLKRKVYPSVSHETIYKYVKNDAKNGGKLFLHLRRFNKKRRKKYGSIEKRGQIKNRISIDNRPKIVNDKIRIGDWEIDTIIGRNSQGGLLTVVERVSKFTLIAKIENKEANTVANTAINLLKPFKDIVYTITADNGKEFAYHDRLSFVLNTQVYFSHPYHSWERGLNENTNGLIRQYFPKKINFKEITTDDIKNITDKLNNRPRKTLGFIAPVQLFYQKLVSEGLLNEKVALVT